MAESFDFRKVLASRNANQNSPSAELKALRQKYGLASPDELQAKTFRDVVENSATLPQAQAGGQAKGTPFELPETPAPLSPDPIEIDKEDTLFGIPMGERSDFFANPVSAGIEQGGKTGAQYFAAQADSIQELGNFAISLSDAGAQALDKVFGTTTPSITREDDGTLKKLTFADDAFGEPQDTEERLTKVLGKYITPIGGLAVATRTLKMGRAWAASAAAMAAFDFAAVDPNDENLSDIVQQHSEFLGPVASILASDPDDSEMLRRAKRAAEGFLLDAALSSVFLGAIHGLKKMSAAPAQVEAKLAFEAESAAKPQKLPAKRASELPIDVRMDQPIADAEAAIAQTEAMRSKLKDSIGGLKPLEPAKRKAMKAAQAKADSAIEGMSVAKNSQIKNRFKQELADALDEIESLAGPKSKKRIGDVRKSAEDFDVEVSPVKGPRKVNGRRLRGGRFEAGPSPAIEKLTEQVKAAKVAQAEAKAAAKPLDRTKISKAKNSGELVRRVGEAMDYDPLLPLTDDILDRMMKEVSSIDDLTERIARAESAKIPRPIADDITAARQGLKESTATDIAMSQELLNNIDHLKGRMIISAMANSVKRRGVLRTAWEDGTVESMAAAIEYMKTNKILVGKTFSEISEIARTLNTQRLLSHSDDDILRARFLAQQADVVGTPAEMRDAIRHLDRLMREVHPRDLVDAISGVSVRSQKRGWFDAALKIRINGLLSSPKTVFGVQVGSALVMGPMSIINRGLGGIWNRTVTGSARGVAKGEATEMARVFMSEGWQQSVGLVTDLRDGFILAGKAVREADTISGKISGATRLLEKQRPSSILEPRKTPVAGLRSQFELSDEVSGMTAESVGTYGWRGDLQNAFSAIISSPSSFIMRMDDAIGAVFHRMELNALAIRKASGVAARVEKKTAALQRKIDQGRINPEVGRTQIEEWGDIYNTLAYKSMDDIVDQDLRKMSSKINNDAAFFANKNKFTIDLEGWSEKINEAIKTDILGVPAMRVLFPFARVDLNILEYAAESTPLAFKMRKYKEIMRSGDVAKIQVARSQIALGSGAMALGAWMAYNGTLTGDPPKNAETRRLMEQAGVQWNSIRVGDTYHNYRKVAGPYSNLLRVAANVATTSSYIVDNPEAQQEIAKIVMATVVDSIEDMTPEFLARTTADMIEAKDDPKSMERFLSNLIIGQVPFSSALRSVRRGEISINPGEGDGALRNIGGDKFKRDVTVDPNSGSPFIEGMYNKLVDEIGIFGWSESLPVRLNIEAQPVIYPPGWGPDIISSVATTKTKSSPWVDEAVRLGIAGPLVDPEPKPGESHLMLKMPDREVSRRVGMLEVKHAFTPEEYNKYVTLSAGVGLDRKFNPFRNKTMAEALNEQVENDYPLIRHKKNKTDQVKRILINAIINAYRDGAKAQMQVTNDTIIESFKFSGDDALEALGESRAFRTDPSEDRGE